MGLGRCDHCHLLDATQRRTGATIKTIGHIYGQVTMEARLLSLICIVV